MKNFHEKVKLVDSCFFLGVFNDIAVASAIALKEYPEKCNEKTPILVLDLDVHQVG